jgi:hypothetical protein
LVTLAIAAAQRRRRARFYAQIATDAALLRARVEDAREL